MSAASDATMAAAGRAPEHAPADQALAVRPRDTRVVFLTNFIPPYWKAIFDALSPRYPNMRILLSTRMERNRQWDIDWDGLDVTVQKTITFRRRWRHPKGFTDAIDIHLPMDTIRQLRLFRPDVIVSAEMGFRTMLALVYRKMRPRSRLIVWADIAESTEHGRGWLRGVLRRRFIENADGIVVLGESGARYIRSLGAEDRKLFRIPYTTAVHRFASVPLARPGIQARRLFYVGRLIEQKGILPFLRVLSKWACAHPNSHVEFVLAGVGPLRSAIEGEPVAANLQLTFLGNIGYADLPHVYAEAGIFVLPTLADTWAVAVNEALASGLPVLGSVYSQAVEELIEDGRNGWLFRPDQGHEMYQAIDRAMSISAAALNDMRQHARETALGLTPEYVAGLVDKLVCEIAGRSR